VTQLRGAEPVFRFVLALGVGAAALATTVTHLWFTGLLPAALMAHRSYWASMRSIRDVPLDFVSWRPSCS
jgi:hypothetical protein